MKKFQRNFNFIFITITITILTTLPTCESNIIEVPIIKQNIIIEHLNSNTSKLSLDLRNNISSYSK